MIVTGAIVGEVFADLEFVALLVVLTVRTLWLRKIFSSGAIAGDVPRLLLTLDVFALPIISINGSSLSDDSSGFLPV